MKATESTICGMDGRGWPSAKPRVASLETSVANAEIRRTDLADSHAAELSIEEQKVEAKLAEVNPKFALQQELVREAPAYSGIAPGTAGSLASYTCSIIRNGEEIAADMSTPVLSGTSFRSAWSSPSNLVP